MSRQAQIADLLRKAGRAQTLTEQTAFVRQAEELKNEALDEKLAANQWNAEDAVIRDTLVPGRVHEMHTAATDWIVDFDTSFDARLASQEMVAEASLWFASRSDEVKSYGDEYAEQARNKARRLAGKFGDGADVAERAFLDEATRLRTTAVKAGLVVEAEADGAAQDPAKPEPSASPEDDPMPNRTAATEDDADDEDDDRPARWRNMNRKDREDWFEAHDNDDSRRHSSINDAAGFDLVASLLEAEAASGLPQVGLPADTAFPSQNGTLPPEATFSTRAPQLQELSDTSGDVVPVNDPGLGQTDDKTGQNATRSSGEGDHASKGTFPVSGNKKESSMQYVACQACGGHGKVAVRKEAASGLPQIDQIVDPHDAPATTPYPADVAYPWVLNPQQQIPAAINQAEQQVAQRDSLSPLLQQQSRQPASRQSVQSARHQAGGRDNSGWMGDNGARGQDYPGEQIGQYPAPSTSEGYADPVYGNGGDNGNQPLKPFGNAEGNDYTNDEDQNWQPGQPTQYDNGARSVNNQPTTAAWRDAVDHDPALASAIAYVQQRYAATARN